MSTISTLPTLETALDVHRAGNLAEADRLYRQILEADADNAEAWHGLGAIAYQKQDYDRTIECVQKALEKNDKSYIFLNTLASAYRGKGEFQQAVQTYSRALDLHPDDATLKHNFSTTWQGLFECDRDAAIEALQALGERYYQKGHLQQAERFYRQVLSLDPQAAKAVHGLGLLAQQTGQSDRAIALIEKAIELDPNIAYFYHNLAGIYHAQNHLQQAVRYYCRAIELDPTLTVAQHRFSDAMAEIRKQSLDFWKSEMFLAARQLHRKEHFRFAFSLYNKLLEVDASDAEVLHARGQLRYQIDQIDLAVVDLNQAVKLDRNNVVFLNNYGLACRAQGSAEAALKCYKRALQLDPNNEAVRNNFETAINDLLDFYHETSQWYYNVGSVDQAARFDLQAGNFLKNELDRVEAALRFYHRAVETDPNCAEAHHVLAEIYLDTKQYDAAIHSAQLAIRARMDLANAYRIIGNAFLHKGNAASAMRAYSQALAIQPNFAEVYSNIGSLLVSQKRLPEAIQHYQKSIEIDPNLASVRWNLGKAFELQGNLDNTIACWQKALELDPKFGGANSYYHLAAKFSVKGKRDEAVQCYQKAIEMQPDFANPYWDLCEVFNIHNQAAGRTLSSRFWQNMSDPKAKLFAGIAYTKSHINSGDGDAALKRYLEIEPLLYEKLPELNANEASRAYLNILFDLPHYRDDVAANSRICRALGQRFVQYLDARSRHENAQPIHYTLKADRATAPLRIGFMSKHFRRHSVGWLSSDIIRELSQLTPHIHCYVTGGMNHDDRTAIFKEITEKFYDSKNYHYKVILDELLKDDLEILVDMDSVTVMSHLEILHRHPVPVCISWLGFDAPYLSDRNYYLGDWYTHPQGSEQYYLEKVVRLPDSFTSVSGLPIRPIDRDPLRKSLRIAPNQTAYLCIATGNKFCPDMIAAQIRILKQVPDSVLLYKGRVGDMQLIEYNYKEECKRQGVRTNRVRLLPRTATEEEHRLIYQIADVLIDSYPYSGSTHVVEALWFNMPVLAIVSEQSFGRQAYSLVKNAGTDLGITWNWEEYVEMGTRLGKDTEFRQLVRQQLERGKQPGTLAPLWNPKKFAGDMYRIFRELLLQQS